ncbi:MAG: PilZ domain-containing protein [Deltaproteobacteria bacterium]|nr:PilZ domain-containing protein [Deltaproteobacteria bacterium]
MEANFAEKRKSERHFFSIQNQVRAAVAPPDGQAENIPIFISGLSTGGFSFLGMRQDAKDITTGDSIVLKKIEDPDLSDIIDNMQVTIRHIIDYKIFLRLAFGCQFNNITDSQEKKIQEYIQTHLM